MAAKLIKKDGHYFLEVEPNTWTPPNRFHSIIANTLDKKEGDVLQLSIKNCQAIERGYDSDELAEKWVFETNGHKWSNNDDTAGDNYLSFRVGFQSAIELMGDKKFSEFLDKEKELGISDIKTIERIQWYYNTYFDKSQQTEWDVEVEMWFHGTRHKKGEWVPKLDADGCLILKRI